MLASVHVRTVWAEKAAGAATLGEIAIEAISAKVELELAAEDEGQDRIEGRAEIASRAADEGLERIRSRIGFDSTEIICGPVTKGSALLCAQPILLRSIRLVNSSGGGSCSLDRPSQKLVAELG